MRESMKARNLSKMGATRGDGVTKPTLPPGACAGTVDTSAAAAATLGVIDTTGCPVSVAQPAKWAARCDSAVANVPAMAAVDEDALPAAARARTPDMMAARRKKDSDK